jgi:hypothetical protein
MKSLAIAITHKTLLAILIRSLATVETFGQITLGWEPPMKHYMRFVVTMIVLIASMVTYGVYRLSKLPPIKVVNEIPDDDVSDVKNAAKPIVDFAALMSNIRQDCNIADDVERDLLSVDFSVLVDAVHRFSFRASDPECFLKLKYVGGQVSAGTYDRWDPD